MKGIEAFPLEGRADQVPVQYTPDEWIDLSGYLRPHADDPDGNLAAWTKALSRETRIGQSMSCIVS